MTGKLTEEIKSVMAKQRIYSLATASKTGVPNVVPVGMLMIHDDLTIWIIDNYMDKTLKNVKENPNASFYVYDHDSPDSFQIKGRVSVENSGPDYEAAVKIAHAKKETYPAKNLLKFYVDSIYYVTPGEKAGKRY
jgi:uncharacterized protein